MFSPLTVKEILKDGIRMTNSYFYTEFEKNYSTFLMTRKMVIRFIKKGVINDKLILNYLIILLNEFGIAKINIAFYMLCSKEEMSIIKSFLMFLNSYVLPNHEIPSNRNIDDLLKDVKVRYSLQ